MTLRHIALLTTAALLAACSAATDTAETTTSKIDQTVTEAKNIVGDAQMRGADLSELPAGTYKSEQGHAYVAFQYWHQGFSRPIIRWGTTDATVIFDADNPENSKLTVTLPLEDIDTGVAAWDDHIKGEGFFDAANHPNVTFVSTDIEQIRDGYGTLTGDLTIKGVTKPFTLTGTVNKVGKHFRSGVDMFGVSATGSLKRSDFGVDKFAPSADDIEIMVEVEFQKAE
jgi:polyisoprenoid-binding protein YceI